MKLLKLNYTEITAVGRALLTGVLKIEIEIEIEIEIFSVLSVGLGFRQLLDTFALGAGSMSQPRPR